jgi:flagellar basal-body rod protein FlgG
VAIGPDGTVRAGTKTVGKISLVTVASPDHLLAAGSNLFTSNSSSGTPRPSAKATIQQGALEGSNVDVGNDMVQMMGAQRSYQLESSAIQTENQMLSIANQLVTQ